MIQVLVVSGRCGASDRCVREGLWVCGVMITGVGLVQDAREVWGRCRCSGVVSCRCVVTDRCEGGVVGVWGDNRCEVGDMCEGGLGEIHVSRGG